MSISPLNQGLNKRGQPFIRISSQRRPHVIVEKIVLNIANLSQEPRVESEVRQSSNLALETTNPTSKKG